MRELMLLPDASPVTPAPPPQPTRRRPGHTRKDAVAQRAWQLWEQPERMTRAWIYTQAINSARHVAGLKPIIKNEFGKGPAAPSEAQRQAVNTLLKPLQKRLFAGSNAMKGFRERLMRTIDYPELLQFLMLKERNEKLTKAIERVWDFYHDIFLQRRTRFAPQLLACDRISKDCYQAVYTRLGEPRPIPAPAPFCYMAPMRSPATFRRFVRVTHLGKLPNPFPLIKVPRRRLMNPWTLGAIPHEVSHNLSSDLKLWFTIPRAILRRLLRENIPRSVARIWARWHKELFADLCGTLLTGPAFVASLIDLLSRSPRRTLAFRPRAVHPGPYLRVFISIELLHRMGFEREATAYRKLWSRLYPGRFSGTLPRDLMQNFSTARRLVVDTVCFQRYRQLGNLALAEVVQFSPNDQVMADQAARRLAAGVDPGIVPERFLISAARVALDRRLARPDVIATNFYQALVRR